jgi:hypothetical protein
MIDFFFFFFLGFISLFSCLRRHADVLYRIKATNVVTSLRLRSSADTVGGKMQQQVRSHRNSLKPHNLKTIKQQLNVGVQ